MKLFGGEWVRGWLRKIGMKEDEVIESSMVGHRIRGAQQKIAQAATDAPLANSAEEWFEHNRQYRLERRSGW